MSNQLLNPLIQFETSDTLYFASSALAFLSESINELSLAEVSDEAQQGLCSLMQCICQALDFEAYRNTSTDESDQLHEALSPLERELVLSLCRHFHIQAPPVAS